MNKIELVARSGNPCLDILVDGRRLAEYFVGQSGAHSSNVIPLGWHSSAPEQDQDVTQQVLGRVPSKLPSGRVAVLVCEECGDVACGALAVRIACFDRVVSWTDWAYENGYESPSTVNWPTYPHVFEFDLAQYEAVFSNDASSA